MVHRVDGPIGVYRGFDDGTDAADRRDERRARDATVLQSRFSLDAHRALGIELVEPRGDRATPLDPAIFHPPAAREPVDGRRVRVDRDELVGQPPQGRRRRCSRARRAARPRPLRADVRRSRARRARAAGALVGAAAVRAARRAPATAGLLRRAEPRRPVLERARSRRSPAACRRSSGGAAATPSSSARAGVGFDGPRTPPAALDRLVAELDERRAAIVVPALADVADRYLEVLRG